MKKCDHYGCNELVIESTAIQQGYCLCGHKQGEPATVEDIDKLFGGNFSRIKRTDVTNSTT